MTSSSIWDLQISHMVNREVCEIIENEYGDAAAYLEAELDITLPEE